MKMYNSSLAYFIIELRLTTLQMLYETKCWLVKC